MIDTIMYNKKEYSLVPKNFFSERFPPGVFRSAILPNVRTKLLKVEAISIKI